jgi:hypothetical protein
VEIRRLIPADFYLYRRILMKWFQKPCLEALDSFKGNKFLNDREIHYDPAMMAALTEGPKKTPYFEGSFDPKCFSPEKLKTLEVVDPKSVTASLHDVHVIKHLFQHFTAHENVRYNLDNVAVFPIPEPDKGVIFAATDSWRIAFYHSKISQASRFLMLDIPPDFLKAHKVDRMGRSSPLEIQDGYLSAETNGVKTALPLEKVCQPGLSFPDVSRMLPDRIEVRELIGGHSPNMRLEDISRFAIKGVKENYIRFLMPKTNMVLAFADSGLWGLFMSVGRESNEDASMPPLVKEVWPHEVEQANTPESNEKDESEAVNEQTDLAA